MTTAISAGAPPASQPAAARRPQEPGTGLTSSGPATSTALAPTSRRSTRSTRRRLVSLAMVVLTVVGGPLLSSAPAHAYTRAWTGADAHSTGHCYDGLAFITTSSTLFDFRRAHVYVNGRFWYTSAWDQRLSVLQETRWTYRASGTTQVLMEYADTLPGGGFAHAYDWVSFGGNNYCIAL